MSRATAVTSLPSFLASRLTVGLLRVLIQAPCPIELRVRALKLEGRRSCNSSAIFLLKARARARSRTIGAAISSVVDLAVPAYADIMREVPPAATALMISACSSVGLCAIFNLLKVEQIVNLLSIGC